MTDFKTLVREIFTHLSFSEVEIELQESAEEVVLQLTVPEDASGILIGYHGEKIDSLQLILSLIYNQDNQAAYKPVRLDINGYRQRRQQALNELSDHAADQAIQSGREIILPPLSSGERRLVHLHLSQRTDVTTYSEGEGRNRRLIVRPTQA